MAEKERYLVSNKMKADIKDCSLTSEHVLVCEFLNPQKSNVHTYIHAHTYTHTHTFLKKKKKGGGGGCMGNSHILAEATLA